jgi:outer membrane scaffolding protein for murein synthesis (MipA/OmpV family)
LTSGAIGVGTVGDPTFGAGTAVKTMRASNNRLAGMGDIHARLLGGGFFNYYLSPGWRLTSSLLWGAGNDRTGGIAELGVQRLAIDLAPHHSMALSAGLSVANRNYNQAFFGVTPCQSAMSANPVYTPGGGAKDAHLSARWNWALSSSWMLSSNLQGERLLGSAKNSPLVERPTNVTVSTALAYRF